MMPHYVEQYLARQLRVRVGAISRWDISVGGSAYGRVEAHVKVLLRCSYGEMADLKERFMADQVGALHADSLTQEMYDQSLAEATLHLTCLYGKETQHLFKAVHQQFTVRGRPAKRRRP